MSGGGARVGVGTRFRYDGEIVEVVQMAATTAGNEVVLKDCRGRLLRLSLAELLFSDRAAVIPDGSGPSADDDVEIASVVLGQLGTTERAKLLERSEHVREVITGFRSGSSELAREGEPRQEYNPELSREARYAAKAAELGVSLRTVKQWVADFRSHGEAGLAPKKGLARRSQVKADERWVETALEVMVEHTGESKPSRTMVIERTRARVIARFGADVVKLPSRATAFRLLEDLERQHPLFRLSAKRNRDIADRPDGVYGKLRPTRPGEYLVMDSTRLDVFAFDPVTLRWLQAELSVGMDWYTRCITGIRITPVSTKAVDVSAVLYQSFRPRPAGRDWPRHAVWPEHGIPRTVLVDVGAVEGPGKFGTPCRRDRDGSRPPSRSRCRTQLAEFPAMDTVEFWTIIEAARSVGAADTPFAEALVDQLAARTKDEILGYQERFAEVHDAVYRWDVWAAAYLIGGGCSDDSFMDFRAGLIALGRDWYERAAACPDSLAEHPAVIAAAEVHRDEALFYEEANYAATGDGEDFYEAWDEYSASRDSSEHDSEDMGEDFDFDDPNEMRRRLPRLVALYLRDAAH
jgi:hypothetical protein